MHCIVKGCERLVKVKKTGLCHTHDMQVRRNGATSAPAEVRLCAVEECERAAIANGLCHKHDMQQKRSGSPYSEVERLRRENEEARHLLKKCHERLDDLAAYGQMDKTIALWKRVGAFLNRSAAPESEERIAPRHQQ
jgi:hypothetical protein